MSTNISSAESQLSDLAILQQIASNFAIYIAYDEDALKTFANAGLLRRAKKDVAADNVDFIIKDKTTDCDNVTQLTLNSDGQTVTLSTAGLTDSRCDCSSVSACKHIVASVIFLQQQVNTLNSQELANDLPSTQAELTEINEEADKNTKGDSPALNEILALVIKDFDTIAKSIGKAQRLKVMAMALSYLQDNHSCQHTQIIDDKHSVRIQLANQESEIRYIAGAGFAGMLSKIERHAEHFHLLALLMVQQRLAETADSNNAIITWLTDYLQEHGNVSTNNQVLLSETVEFLADLQFEISQLISLGISNVEPYFANRMHLQNILARSHGLHNLAMQLRMLSGRIHDFIKGDNHANEWQILSLLADISAHSAQLQHAQGNDFQSLCGKQRQQYDSDSTKQSLTLYPLGARWWHSQGKARGLSLYFYEPNDQEYIELTQARAQNQDITFDKHSAWHNALWLSSAESLMLQQSTLYNPRFSNYNGAGGQNALNQHARLAITGSQVSRNTPLNNCYQDYISLLDDIGYDNWQILEQTWAKNLVDEKGIGSVLVVTPAHVGSLLIDEVEQCVWWQLFDKEERQLLLRLDWNSNAQQSIQRIKKLENIDARQLHKVVVYVSQRDDNLVFEPITLIMQDNIFHLDYSNIKTEKKTLKELLSHKITKLVSKKKRLVTEITTEAIKPPSLTAVLCNPVVEVLTSMSASGRLQPTEEQIKQLAYQQKLASDAGVFILADAIHQLHKLVNTQQQKIVILKLVYVINTLFKLKVQLPVD